MGAQAGKLSEPCCPPPPFWLPDQTRDQNLITVVYEGPFSCKTLFDCQSAYVCSGGSEDGHQIPAIDTKICAGLLVCCFMPSAPTLIIVGTLIGGRSWCGMTLRLQVILALATVNSPCSIFLWIILAVSARCRADSRRRRAGLVARPCHGMRQRRMRKWPSQRGTAQPRLWPRADQCPNSSRCVGIVRNCSYRSSEWVQWQHTAGD